MGKVCSNVQKGKEGRFLKPQILLICKLGKFPGGPVKESIIKEAVVSIISKGSPRTNVGRVTAFPFLPSTAAGWECRRRWETLSLTWSWQRTRSPVVPLLTKPCAPNSQSVRQIYSCLSYCHWKVLINGSTSTWRTCLRAPLLVLCHTFL